MRTSTTRGIHLFFLYMSFDNNNHRHESRWVTDYSIVPQRCVEEMGVLVLLLTRVALVQKRKTTQL